MLSREMIDQSGVPQGTLAKWKRTKKGTPTKKAAPLGWRSVFYTGITEYPEFRKLLVKIKRDMEKQQA